ARVHVEDSEGLGLVVHDSSASVEDMTLSDIRERNCERGCNGLPLGIGAGVYGGGSLELRRAHLGPAPLCGIHLATGGQLSATQSLVQNTGIGLCVEGEASDLSELDLSMREVSQRVSFSSSLPVPDPADGLQGAR